MLSDIKLPPVFELNENHGGNTIRQLLVPAELIKGTIADFQEERFKSKIIIPAEDFDQKILLVRKSSPMPASIPRAIRIGEASLPTDNSRYDLIAANWLKHPLLNGKKLSTGNNLQQVIDSWKGAFSYIKEEPGYNIKGLRNPQIGAIHSIHGYWTISDEVATVVMPTGTGKTETMLAIMLSTPCEKILVIVPTDALRAQIAEKFLTLGIFKDKDCRVLKESALYPVVGILRHKPQDVTDVDSFFGRCHVIVTTSQIAGQCAEEIQDRMAHHCPYLFIDEAHHVEAPTWRAFKERFLDKRILQFTATPFREDGKPLDGKIVFKYPLKKAQDEDYFKPIRFEEVWEFNTADYDKAVAERAVEQLRRDEKYNHILMARVDSVERAKQVFPLYEKYAEYKPVQIHTGIKSNAKREELRRKIVSGESRIVVCVDMLGEGFDLPELKIAAFHDIRKSLAVTLQLAGRFTRSRPDLGDATFVANLAEVDVQDELRKLYTRDPDWNHLLPQLSDTVIETQMSFKEFIDGFANFPDDVPLKQIKPATSTVVYRTQCENWRPERFRLGIPGIASFERVISDINHQQKTLIIVTARKKRIEWAEIDEIYNWDWELYVVIWDEKQKLLFINNSSNEGEFKGLAVAVAGDDVQIVNEQEVFRSFAGIERLKLQNVGLTEQLGRLVRFTGRMGGDVGAGLTEAQKQNARKAVLSGTGFENGTKVTVGASRKGRIWSFRREHVGALVNWCKSIGAKVIDESIDPDEILKGTLESTTISKLPQLEPVHIDWPERIYKEPEPLFWFVEGTVKYPLLHSDISLLETKRDEALRFEIASGDWKIELSLHLFEDDETAHYRFEVIGNRQVSVKYRGVDIAIEDFFYEEPPIVWFVDGSSLEGTTFTPLKTKYEPYDTEKILAWTWDGIDLRKESQGVAKAKGTIQYRVIEELKKADYDVVFDDDGTGESADVVTIKVVQESVNKHRIDVEFYHCKYSKRDPGQRIKDMYEVCGQAQKSIRWMYSHEKQIELFSHLLRREPKKAKLRTATRFEVGDKDKLVTIREMARVWPINLKIFIVQPGLSKSGATVEQRELLSVTENHLMETYKLKFFAIASA